ncbi:MAG: glycosyltransferase family 4 protein [Myxococcota bacterium]|nr:glycosyltransferase family 4 protein [Myxococcota bacterium]
MTASVSNATLASEPVRREGESPAAEPPRPIRVLFLNDTARNGGPGRSLHSILKFLDPAVVHRAVILPRPGPIAELLSGEGVVDDLRFEPNLVENPIEPWTRPMERRDFDAALAVKAARLVGNAARVGRALVRLSSLAKRGRYDLIYCNGTNADFAGGALAAATGVPALWHVRYTSLPLAVVGLHRKLSASRGVRRVVCVSQAAAALFAHCPSKVRVINNALDVSAFDPASVQGTLRRELGLPSDAIVFGSHGRVLRRKGYVELIGAARRVIDGLTEPERARVVFAVVGDTPEDFSHDHVAECRRLAAALGLASRFHMMGFRADVRPLVIDFDVAVVPSVYPDPLPRAVIESMALGKPVIAFDVGGVMEMIDRETGELVPFEPARSVAGDRVDERARIEGGGASSAAVERLAEAMIRYARDPELRSKQGRAGRLRVEREFDARAHARRIQAEIVAASGRGARSRGR